MRQLYPVIGVATLCVSALAQVNLPPGFETVEIAVDDQFTDPPSINNCGQIVYSKQPLDTPPYDPEVFLYDNGRIVQITDNDVPDAFPVIDDLGDIAWTRYLPDRDLVQLVFLRDGMETIVDEAWNINSVRINNRGHLAWSHYFPGECNWNLRVMFWDGASVVQITPPEEYYNQGIGLNDYDEIVWTHYDVCQWPWTGRIQAYWDGQIVDLPSVTSQDQAPDINNSRHVTWSAGQDSVLLKDGRIITLVQDFGGAPDINNHDTMAMLIWNEGVRSWLPWTATWRGREKRFFQLSEACRDWGGHDINDYGEVAFSYINDIVNGDWGGGIMLLRRARNGGMDGDQRIGLRDYRSVFGCMTGPTRTDDLCQCRFADMDFDGDIDLADVAAFQNAFDPG